MSEEDRDARALRESEQRFRALSEAAREAVFIHESRIIREVNQALTQLIGFSREELIGKDGMEFLAPESRLEVERSMRSTGSGGTSEIVLIAKNGERLVVESSSEPLVYQGKPMRVVTMQDLTARRRAEAALHESDQRLRLAMSAARMGSWEWLISRDTVLWSPEMFDVFGIAPSSYDGTYNGYLAVVHPEDRERVQRTIGECLESSSGEVSFEHRVLGPNGALRWVENRGRVFRDAAGHTLRMAGTSMDATRRHELEEQLLHSQRMEATGRLAAGIAHDFNNLLTVIMSYAELGRFTLDSMHPSYEAFEQINVAAQRAAALTRQLLIFARKEVTEAKVVDLNHLVENVARLLHRIVGEDVIVSVDLCASPVPVKIDPVQCEQLLMNLAVNARDAMPAGGSLSIRTALEANVVRVRVSDTGVGMPSQIRQRAFEPFFTTKGAGKGTGLGLSTCLAIVRGAGGDIAVESEVGRGTTFCIELPRSTATSSPEVDDRTSSMPRGSETVLLIEDDAVVRQLTARILRRQGYTVLVATQADEAMQLASNHDTRIDLFLSDVVMPGQSGPSVIERLSAVRPRTKVLFVSGYPGDDISRRGIDESSFRFLAKPYSSEQLAQRVRQVLDD